MSGEAIGAIVLAAGGASRYGAPKQLLPVAGMPMIRRAALVAMGVATRVVVVTGAYREQVEACLADLAVEFAFNNDWQRGMGGSIARGVEHLVRTDASVRACLIMLADQPLITATDLLNLINAHRQWPGRIIVSRYHGETSGPPSLFPGSCFDELLGLEEATGARPVIRRHAANVKAVSIPHAAIDVDVPEDYGKWIANCTRA